MNIVTKQIIISQSDIYNICITIWYGYFYMIELTTAVHYAFLKLIELIQVYGHKNDKNLIR